LQPAPSRGSQLGRRPAGPKATPPSARAGHGSPAQQARGPRLRGSSGIDRTARAAVRPGAWAERATSPQLLSAWAPRGREARQGDPWRSRTPVQPPLARRAAIAYDDRPVLPEANRQRRV